MKAAPSQTGIASASGASESRLVLTSRPIAINPISTTMIQ